MYIFNQLETHCTLNFGIKEGAMQKITHTTFYAWKKGENKAKIISIILPDWAIYHRVTCGILVPPPGTEPGPSAVSAGSSNQWTARESPLFNILKEWQKYRIINSLMYYSKTSISWILRRWITIYIISVSIF